MSKTTTTTDLTISDRGSFSYTSAEGNATSACFSLFLIKSAWSKGCSFEDLADGFGKGQGTMGDWSAIRDSSDEAEAAMLARAIDHLELA